MLHPSSSLQPPTVSTSIPPASGEPKAGSKGKSKGVQRSNNTNSARNLCALDWMEANPGGLAADFKMYFDQLPKDKLKKWKEKEKAAKAARGPDEKNNDLPIAEMRETAGGSH